MCNVLTRELQNLGVFQVDTGGVTANKELKISIPAPEWVTEDHQLLVARVVNIRGVEELIIIVIVCGTN